MGKWGREREGSMHVPALEEAQLTAGGFEVQRVVVRTRQAID